MILITNKKRHPIPVVVRSKKDPRAFTTLNIPGVGSGNNTRWLADEQTTIYVERAEKMGFITTKYMAHKGEN